MRLHCENDYDDVDEDYNNNGLRSPKNVQYETVYFKKLHKDRASRAGAALVSTITSVYLFFTY